MDSSAELNQSDQAILRVASQIFVVRLQREK